MIITFSTKTVDTRNGDVTYWFNIKLPGYECTALDAGFNKDGKMISASGSVLALDPTVQKEIEKATAPMVARLV